jgi:hypothetical protein
VVQSRRRAGKIKLSSCSERAATLWHSPHSRSSLVSLGKLSAIRERRERKPPRPYLPVEDATGGTREAAVHCALAQKPGSIHEAGFLVVCWNAEWRSAFKVGILAAISLSICRPGGPRQIIAAPAVGVPLLFGYDLYFNARPVFVVRLAHVT